VKKMIKNTPTTRAHLLFAAAMTAAIFGALALFSAGAPAKGQPFSEIFAEYVAGGAPRFDRPVPKWL